MSGNNESGRRSAGRGPLSAEEAARIHAWERRMIRFYAAAMVALILATLLLARFADDALVRRSVLALILLLMAAGAWVQFREKCPRCGEKLGKQSRLLLPRKCRRCGVEFPRPETLG